MSTRRQVLGVGPNKNKYIPSNDKSRGLGDTIEKFTKATGIKKAVDAVANATGKDCGCGKRKDSLNRIFPYDK
jgi:hypothetical protein